MRSGELGGGKARCLVGKSTLNSARSSSQIDLLRAPGYGSSVSRASSEQTAVREHGGEATPASSGLGGGRPGCAGVVAVGRRRGRLAPPPRAAVGRALPAAARGGRRPPWLPSAARGGARRPPGSSACCSRRSTGRRRRRRGVEDRARARVRGKRVGWDRARPVRALAILLTTAGEQGRRFASGT